MGISPCTHTPLTDSILGVVLAGGASTRLGQPKQYLKLYGAQEPDLLSRTVSLMARCAQEVRVSCRQGDVSGAGYAGNASGTGHADNAGYAGYAGYAGHVRGVPEVLKVPKVLEVPDVFDGFGPMSGIHAGLTALQHSPHAAMLVLPCDVPFMTEAVLQKLLARRHAAKQAFPSLLMTTYRQSHTGYIEALVSVYEPACLSYFHRALEENRRQINLVIPPEHIVDIVYTPAEARPFFNINFPDELAQASLYAQ